MKKLFIATTLTLALCEVANAYTSQDIDIKLNTQEQKNEIYQNFIWDQEKLNFQQSEVNKQCYDFILNQKDLNSQISNKLNSSFKAPEGDIDRLKSKVRDLESEVDRLRSINSRIDQRLMTLERKVK